jgi:hypothetical protein
MPLLDHFRPPLSVNRPWEGFHSNWATKIADQLNKDLLPPDYFAISLVTVAGGVEVDVGTFHEESATPAGNGAVATAVWAPPQPLLAGSVDLPLQDSIEIQVLQETGGPKLRAAIELVSPGNKDRPSNRQALAIKCAGYLQQGISVVIIDVVTERAANMHMELIETLHLPAEFAWRSATGLSAIAYRLHRQSGQITFEVWPETLKIGNQLPVLPLWLDEKLCVPLRLEESYRASCVALRIRE